MSHDAGSPAPEAAPAWSHRVPFFLRKAPYHAPVPLSADAIRLDANELSEPMPTPLCAELAEILAAAAHTRALGRYPDAKAHAAKAALATYLRAQGAASADERWLCLGNGSDELISTLCIAFSAAAAGARALVAYPDPTFVVYRMAALASGAEVVELPLASDFSLAPELLEELCASRSPNLVFLALPNNPTGTLWSLAAVQALAQAHPSTIFVADEAYAHYSGGSLLGALASTPNLVVLRTLSKIGLPGLRLGMACAQPRLIEVLERARMPYNVGTMPQAVAAWFTQRALPWADEACQRIVAAREPLAAALAASQPTWTVYPSAANFLLVRVAPRTELADRATPVANALAAAGIAVRNLHRPGPLHNCLRVTVGTPPQNDALLTAVHQLG